MSFDESLIDPLDMAIYQTVHEYKNSHTGKKGALGLSAAVGMAAPTLQNKANPMHDLQQLSLKEARTVMLATGDHRMLHQLAHDLGEACVPTPTLDVVGDSDVLEALTIWQESTGKTAKKLREIYEDKRVEMHEVEQLRLALIHEFEMGLALVDVVKGQAEPDKGLKVVK